MATLTNTALKTQAARIQALVEAAGAVVVSCSMSTCGFTMRTDDVGAALVAVKLARLFADFSVADATAAEIRHFGSYTRTVRGRI